MSMMLPGTFFGLIFRLLLLAGLILVAILVLKMLFAIVRGVGRGVGTVLGRVFTFVRGEINDAFATVGSVFSGSLYAILIALNSLTGRTRSVSFYGRAMEREIFSMGRSLHNIAIGHPARLLGLKAGETRFAAPPSTEPLGAAPRLRPRPAGSSRPRTFDGYQVVGSLPPGGSGGQLYIARPTEGKRADLERQGSPAARDLDRVVIKSFSLQDGSTLPQIVRESRALEPARKVGLVLDHRLDDDVFYYVMPYVPGDDLGVVTEKLHRKHADGLGPRELSLATRYVGHLLETLERFHAAGLWHKDVKPSNVIVSNDRAHLVDLGLITPLRSAMTLTTHGTEYFRDPELVRMAMKGVKVHQVPGAKFDVYGVGAVLYSVLEGSFPAHGGLSKISKRCPEALRWVVRRAMADLANRYESANEMLVDLRAVMTAKDPYKVKPIDLPSLNGRPLVDPVEGEEPLAANSAPRARESRRRKGSRVFVWGRGLDEAERVFDEVEASVDGVGAAARRAVDEATSGLRGLLGGITVTTVIDTDEDKKAKDPAPPPSSAPRSRPSGFRSFARALSLLALVAIGGCVVASTLYVARHDPVVRFDRGESAHLSVGSLEFEADRRGARLSTDRFAAEASREGLRIDTYDKPTPAPRLPGTLVEGDASAAVAAARPDGVTSREAGAVLVVNDLPPTVDPAIATSVDAVLGSLAVANYDLVGLGDDTEDIELLALARKVVGLAQPGDADAPERLARLFAAGGDELDAVLWIGRDDDGELQSVLVSQLDYDASPLRALLEGRAARGAPPRATSKPKTDDADGPFTYRIY